MVNIKLQASDTTCSKNSCLKPCGSTSSHTEAKSKQPPSAIWYQKQCTNCSKVVSYNMLGDWYTDSIISRCSESYNIIWYHITCYLILLHDIYPIPPLALEELRKATRKPAAVLTHDINILAFRYMHMSNSHNNRLTCVSKLNMLDQVESFPICSLCTR